MFVTLLMIAKVMGGGADDLFWYFYTIIPTSSLVGLSDVLVVFKINIFGVCRPGKGWLHHFLASDDVPLLLAFESNLSNQLLSECHSPIPLNQDGTSLSCGETYCQLSPTGLLIAMTWAILNFCIYHPCGFLPKQCPPHFTDPTCLHVQVGMQCQCISTGLCINVPRWLTCCPLVWHYTNRQLPWLCTASKLWFSSWFGGIPPTMPCPADTDVHHCQIWVSHSSRNRLSHELQNIVIIAVMECTFTDDIRTFTVLRTDTRSEITWGGGL